MGSLGRCAAVNNARIALLQNHQAATFDPLIVRIDGSRPKVGEAKMPQQGQSKGIPIYL